MRSRFNTDIVNLHPKKFYEIAERIVVFRSANKSKDIHLNERVMDCLHKVNQLKVPYEDVNSYLKATESVYRKTRSADEYDGFDDKDMSGSGEGFFTVFTPILANLSSFWKHIVTMIEGFNQEITLSDNRALRNGIARNYEEFQLMKYELELNAPPVNAFMNSLNAYFNLTHTISDLCTDIEYRMHKYFISLQKRFSSGMKVHGNAVITDIMFSIFENVEKDGTTKTSAKQVSAYSKHKALQILNAVEQSGILEDKDLEILKIISDNLNEIKWVSKEAKTIYETSLHDVLQVIPQSQISGILSAKILQIDLYKQRILELNPLNVKSAEADVIISPEDKILIDFRNETIKQMVALKSDVDKLIEYLFNRKEELDKKFQDENSFYVCKIGHGNPFTGQAPGALVVVPGNKPNVDIDDIVGSGFPDVKNLFKSVEETIKWKDLFILTSPSKSADKANVLLVGPPGCGKSECLRAVANHSGSIAVYAQGSDFLTCWKGEAEKNPKRMFEACLKLHQESGRRVYILIDEIDSVLNEDKAFGATNLTLEFQMLMDGIVNFPGLSVWGTTNHPERIPMPMIRRFNTLLIVGELDPDHRKILLKKFLSNLPCDMKDKDWDCVSEKLNGAVGDTIRKISDHIWRQKLTEFCKSHPKKADELVEKLNTGIKFDLRHTPDELKKEVVHSLANFFKINHDDLDKTVTQFLKNIGIHHEIETAKESYGRHREFIAQISQ